MWLVQSLMLLRYKVPFMLNIIIRCLVRIARAGEGVGASLYQSLPKGFIFVCAGAFAAACSNNLPILFQTLGEAREEWTHTRVGFVITLWKGDEYLPGFLIVVCKHFAVAVAFVVVFVVFAVIIVIDAAFITAVFLTRSGGK